MKPFNHHHHLVRWCSLGVRRKKNLSLNAIPWPPAYPRHGAYEGEEVRRQARHGLGRRRLLLQPAAPPRVVCHRVGDGGGDHREVEQGERGELRAARPRDEAGPLRAPTRGSREEGPRWFGFGFGFGLGLGLGLGLGSNPDPDPDPNNPNPTRGSAEEGPRWLGLGLGSNPDPNPHPHPHSHPNPNPKKE